MTNYNRQQMTSRPRHKLDIQPPPPGEIDAIVQSKLIKQAEKSGLQVGLFQTDAEFQLHYQTNSTIFFSCQLDLLIVLCRFVLLQLPEFLNFLKQQMPGLTPISKEF